MKEVIVKIILLGAAIAALGWVFLKDLWADFQTIRQDPKKFWRTFWKNWGEPLLVAGVMALFIRTFLFAPYKIPSGSMIPTLLVGDKIFVNKISYRFHPPERGDIIVFKYPVNPKLEFVKRLVGLPGERLEIREGVLLVDGKPLTNLPFSNVFYYNPEDVAPDFKSWKYGHKGQVFQVPEHMYFAMGDNSSNSSDGRNWGFIPAHNVSGKAMFIWWPPKRVKGVK